MTITGKAILAQFMSAVLKERLNAKRIRLLHAPITKKWLLITRWLKIEDMFFRLVALICLSSFLTGCFHVPATIEPMICAPLHPKEIQRETRGLLCLPKDFSVCPFAPLTPEEAVQDWGKEYHIALSFAADFDLYRAITGFKRALCLLPFDLKERRLELEYNVALAYFLGRKYVETAFSVESTDLISVDDSFPAYFDLLLILFDSYDNLGKTEHAAFILQLIEQRNPEVAYKLTLLDALKKANLEVLRQEAAKNEQIGYVENVMCGYQKSAKSVRKAELLNAVLPGAGYWYVGLKQTAITALLVNSLFIATGVTFLQKGHTAAGIITLSLEGGWYFGGIYGGGLAAKSYNERLYCQFADKITQREKLFPMLMLKYTF